MRKILVSAYGCEPNVGSEQGVGWNWVLQMAKNNKLFVITRANNRDKIEGNVPCEVADNITFYYYDTPNILKRLKNRAKGLYLYYFFWQIGILPLAKTIVQEEVPDYSMHLTFGSMWMPTFMPLLKTPFIWGPIGGGDCEPYSFFKTLPLKQRLQACVRLLMNKTISINPFINFVCKRAVAIICRTDSSGDVLAKRYANKKTIIIETAMEEFAKPQVDSVKIDSLSLITTGRLMPSKNIMVVIDALADKRFEHIDFRYTIIGSGPDKERIIDRIEECSLENRVSIIDQISRDEVIGHLLNSDIFLFPSLREGGSWALMEAMQTGLPVICLDWSGMKVITDDNCAIRLPVTDPEQMAKDMADAIVRLVNDPALRIQMGRAGQKRIGSEFNWDAKGDFMERLFDKLDLRELDLRRSDLQYDK